MLSGLDSGGVAGELRCKNHCPPHSSSLTLVSGMVFFVREKADAACVAITGIVTIKAGKWRSLSRADLAINRI